MVRVFKHYIAFGTLLEMVADILMCMTAVLLAIVCQSRFGTHFSSDVSLESTIGPAGMFAVLMATLYGAMGVYKRHEAQSFGTAVARALVAIVLGGVIAYAVFGAFPGGQPIRASFGYALILLFGGMLLIRQAQFSAKSAGVGVRRVLIVGTGKEARDVDADISKLGGLGYEVVGFYPAGPTPSEVDERRTLSADMDLNTLVSTLRVDEVVVALREQRGGVLPLESLLDCRVKGIPVIDLAGFYERSRSEVPIDHLKTSWLLYGHGFSQGTARTIIKRGFDLLAACTLIALTWPLMIIAAIAIRLETPGGVIFRQERTGLGGRVFTCFKFRSMGKDAEKNGVAVWAKTNDVRITRVGQFIRKTRIDELPQLFNVLRGDMSLVGPRPERPTFVEQLKNEIPFYDIRHTVKPGLTGWAQVRFSYGASIEDSRRKLQFDLYYVKNHSLFLDMLTLFETVRVVVFREGSR
jgi:sugar transferase (PEP-CTERM system associated)